jgi:hypothetical protein
LQIIWANHISLLHLQSNKKYAFPLIFSHRINKSLIFSSFF